jgi:hypothetical protein
MKIQKNQPAKRLSDATIGYDIENHDVSSTREVTVQCNGKRFRILMELAKGCYGNCGGCSLSTVDRGTPPPFDLAKIKEHLFAFIPHIKSKKNLRTTVVNYGVGDYFLHDAKDLEALAALTRGFFDELPTARNVISLSTSLLTKPHKMEEKVRAITRHLHPTQVVFDAVLDPERMESHFDQYRENLSGLTKHFPFVDVVVNLHSGVNEMQAAQIHQFATHASVLNLDMQYALNNTNGYRVQMEQGEFEVFWRRLWVDFKGEGALQKITLSVNEPLVDQDMPLKDLIVAQLQSGAEERVLVDGNGLVHAVGFGFGDVLLDERQDLPPIGEIKNGVFEPRHQWWMPHTMALLKQSMSAPCRVCEHVKTCHGTGYAWYQRMSEGHNKACQNPAKVFFDMRGAV